MQYDIITYHAQVGSKLIHGRALGQGGGRTKPGEGEGKEDSCAADCSALPEVEGRGGGRGGETAG